jgi:hypothetical protein
LCDQFPAAQWDHWIGDLPLQPSEYLVGLLFKDVHLGFEGQVVPVFLIFVLQWMVYSAVVYLLLAISWKKRDAASGR